MKIYTKTGDGGMTGLQGGSRVLKSDLRIQAYGAIDETNSCIGIVLSHSLDFDIRELLIKIQNELFIAGSDLSNPDMTNTNNRITGEMVTHLERIIDKYETELTPLTNFILPGGNTIAAFLHLARTVDRRAETLFVELSETQKLNPECQKYLNRLSDLLFVLARVTNKRANVNDIIWKL